MEQESKKINISPTNFIEQDQMKNKHERMEDTCAFLIVLMEHMDSYNYKISVILG